MHRNLQEILLDDYLDLDYKNDDDDQYESITMSLDNEQFTHNNIIYNEKTSKEYIRDVLHHSLYDYFMAFVVVSSSITLGLSLETDEEYVKNEYRQTLIYALDEILIAILLLEFILKLYVESKNYWFNLTNLYDFIIILFGFIEIMWNLFFQKLNVTIKNVLKGFRLLQLIRLYRIIKISQGLQILTKALIKTVLTYTFTVGILIFLFVYIVAVIGQMLYGKPEESPWHRFPTSLVIAMRLILVDNWNLIGPELTQAGSPPISRWFFVIVVFIGNRIVTNILVGLMIESISSENDDYIKAKREEKSFRNYKKREELNKRMEQILKLFLKFTSKSTYRLLTLGTVEVLNTRFSGIKHKENKKDNIFEEIKAKLKQIHNEIITPQDFIFSVEWLNKLITCSEKTHNEAKSIRQLTIHIIQSLSDIIDENMNRIENDISNEQNHN